LFHRLIDFLWIFRRFSWFLLGKIVSLNLKIQFFIVASIVQKIFCKSLIFTAVFGLIRCYYSKNSHNAQVKFQFPKKSCTIRILLRFWNYSTNYIFFTKIWFIHKFQLRFNSVYILFSKNQQIINAFIVLNVKKTKENKKIVFEITPAKIRKWHLICKVLVAYNTPKLKTTKLHFSIAVLYKSWNQIVEVCVVYFTVNILLKLQ
jgi:hypothetical protein